MTTATQTRTQQPTHINLRDAVYRKAPLTQEHLNSFKSLFLKGMRSRRRMYQIERLDFESLAEFEGKWWATRIIFYPDGRCGYVAGQDYPAEITMIRNDIVGFK